MATAAEGWRLREQKPIKLSDSVPEPDLVILAVRWNAVSAAIPGRRTSASSSKSRIRRWRVIAATRVRLCPLASPFIGSLISNQRQVEIYTEPKAGKTPAYRRRTDFGSDARVPLTLDEAAVSEVAVSSLLPRQVNADR